MWSFVYVINVKQLCFFIKARVVHWTLPSTISPVKMVGIYPILLVRKLPFLFIMYSFDVPRNRNLSVLIIIFKKKNVILTFHTYWNSVCVRVWGRYYTRITAVWFKPQRDTGERKEENGSLWSNFHRHVHFIQNNPKK